MWIEERQREFIAVEKLIKRFGINRLWEFIELLHLLSRKPNGKWFTGVAYQDVSLSGSSDVISEKIKWHFQNRLWLNSEKKSTRKWKKFDLKSQKNWKSVGKIGKEGKEEEEACDKCRRRKMFSQWHFCVWFMILISSKRRNCEWKDGWRALRFNVHKWRRVFVPPSDAGC